jgi:hypothetical protein
MAICSGCIVPEDFPKIEMKDGICSFCRLNAEKMKDSIHINKDGELKSLLVNYSHKGHECIVPLSGGKDSTYILFYLVKKMQLNPLAVFFDSGFTTQDAINNVKEICRKLNVELVIKKSSKYRRKIVQESWYISYYSRKIGNFCVNCENNIRSSVINEAFERGIKYIVWGSTDYEDSTDNFLDRSSVSFRHSFASTSNFFKKSFAFIKSIARLFLKGGFSFGTKLKIFTHRIKHMHYYVMDNISLKAPAGLGRYSPFLEVSFKNKKTETVYFYDFVPYDPFQQIKILEKEVGWKAPSDREAKMDCTLHHIGNLTHFKRTGITDTGFKLSVLVRNGMISREDAILKEKKEIEFIRQSFKSENLDMDQALAVIKDLVFNQVN